MFINNQEESIIKYSEDNVIIIRKYSKNIRIDKELTVDLRPRYPDKLNEEAIDNYCHRASFFCQADLFTQLQYVIKIWLPNCTKLHPTKRQILLALPIVGEGIFFLYWLTY